MKKKLNTNLYLNFKSNFSPDDFHHVAFKTTNYEIMVEFYKNLFGCMPLYESDLITFLAYDNEHHRIAIANTSGVLKNLNFVQRFIMRFKIFLNRKLPSLEGLDHVSYRVSSIEKWFDFYFSAKDRGLIPYWTINHGWISGVYYKDPDNNLVEVFFEHFSSADEFKNNISSDFEDEPIGTNMDIEILHRMYKSGVPLEELVIKGNTVPKGKKPIYGLEAVMNMDKKFKD